MRIGVCSKKKKICNLNAAFLDLDLFCQFVEKIKNLSCQWLGFFDDATFAGERKKM